jgi:hypothetical protein
MKKMKQGTQRRTLGVQCLLSYGPIIEIHVEMRKLSSNACGVEIEP